MDVGLVLRVKKLGVKLPKVGVNLGVELPLMLEQLNEAHKQQAVGQQLKEDEQAVVPRKVGAELGLVPKKLTAEVNLPQELVPVVSEKVTAGVPKAWANLVVVYEKALEAMTEPLIPLTK